MEKHASCSNARQMLDVYPDFPLELNEEDTNSNDIKLGSRNVKKWYDYFIEKKINH